MSVTISVADLKANYIQKLNGLTEYDVVLASIIADTLASAVEYIDDADITSAADLSSVLTRQLMKQCGYEFTRRNDLGLASTSSPDGSVSKYEVDEWLPSVKDALDRQHYYTV